MEVDQWAFATGIILRTKAEVILVSTGETKRTNAEILNPTIIQYYNESRPALLNRARMSPLPITSQELCVAGLFTAVCKFLHDDRGLSPQQVMAQVDIIGEVVHGLADVLWK